MNKSATKSTSIFAWLVFIFSAAFLFYKYILQVSPSVMTDDFMRAFDLSGTGLGILVGFYFYTYMVMQIPSGILLDRFGAHKPTALAIFVCACGALLLAKTHNVQTACLARLLMGFGAAFGTTSYMKLASQWFAPRFFPLLSGLFGTACMLGAATAEAPMAIMVNSVGWRSTLLITALIGFALMACFYWVAHPRHQSGAQSNHQDSKFQWHYLRDMLKRRSNLSLILYGGLAFTPATVFGGLWGVPFLMSAYSVDKATAANSVSLVFFGFALGGFLAGLIGKSCQRLKPMMIIGTTVATVLLTVVIYVPHLPYSWASCCLFLYGLFSAGYLMAYPVAKNINAQAIVGTVIGVFNMGDPLCGAIADPLVGKILDMHWHGKMVHDARVFDVSAFHAAFSVIITYLILAVLCCFFIKETA